ncbi:MAG: peroxiredoxin family protein [Nocardioides sp.]
MPLLNAGDTFPDLDVTLVGGGTLHVPTDLSGGFGVVLFNRGAWCPYCNAQLSGFQRVKPQLDELGVSVVSLSVDNEEDAAEAVQKQQLTFPVGHSADAGQLAELTGAFVNPDPVFVQATGFVLAPDGTVLLSAYSSGAIGRITGADTVGMIRHVKEQSG